MRITRILLVDDHAVVRKGLRLVIEREPDLEVVDEAGSLADALASTADPDVVVTDLMLGDAQGAEVVAAMRERLPNARILVLSMVGTSLYIHRCLAAGARGYIQKEAAAEDLVEAIRKVGDGQDYVHPALGAAHMRRLPVAPFSPANGLDSLTPREIEVLGLLALGHTNSEIAELMSVSTRTAEAHRGRIMAKLGARNRAELVKAANGAGLMAIKQRPEQSDPERQFT